MEQNKKAVHTLISVCTAFLFSIKPLYNSLQSMIVILQ
ncbi:hypothetical protein BTH41_00432 [Bacillus mycoides]|nr:hypothetical protein BTH41_00432 [Bacillus mycoides]